MDLVKRVKTYRLTPALDQRLRLAEEIYHEIKSSLHDFIFGRLKHPVAQDVFQETLKAVTASLAKFSGDSDPYCQKPANLWFCESLVPKQTPAASKAPTHIAYSFAMVKNGVSGRALAAHGHMWMEMDIPFNSMRCPSMGESPFALRQLRPRRARDWE